MSDATAVDMSLQQSCDAAMLHANVEVRLLIDKANRLESENAKLRELISDCMLMPGPYGEKYGIEPNFIVCSNHWGDRARDLGIEV